MGIRNLLTYAMIWRMPGLFLHRQETFAGHILMKLDKIETFCIKNGIRNTVFGRPVWDSGLRPYLKPYNTGNLRSEGKFIIAGTTLYFCRKIIIFVLDTGIIQSNYNTECRGAENPQSELGYIVPDSLFFINYLKQNKL